MHARAWCRCVVCCVWEWGCWGGVAWGAVWHGHARAHRRLPEEKHAQGLQLGDHDIEAQVHLAPVDEVGIRYVPGSATEAMAKPETETNTRKRKRRQNFKWPTLARPSSCNLKTKSSRHTGLHTCVPAAAAAWPRPGGASYLSTAAAAAGLSPAECRGGQLQGLCRVRQRCCVRTAARRSSPCRGVPPRACAGARGTPRLA